MKLSRSLLLVAVLLSTAFAGCAENGGDTTPSTPATGATPTTPTTPSGGQTYVVGTEAAFPPFEDIDANGDFVGYDMDVIREIARRNGWTLDIRNLGFDVLIPSVQNDQIDFAISAMSITSARSEVVDFSIAYYEANQSVTLRADETRNFSSLEDMRGQEIVFGVQAGTTAIDVIESELPDAQIRRYDSYPLAVQALKNGDVDAVMMDAPAQREAASGDPGIRVAFEFSTGDIYGIAVKKGRSDVLNQVNDALEDMEDDGTLAQLRTKWGI